MNTKQRKRQRDIKTKLMAAICMLLVSSIMMVSTTYAWFTLSTAPEVTGINTAVGANGNLEMALLPESGDAEQITSGQGDSMLATVARNITWGNLVDLSEESYGLSQITLYPAALNYKDGGTTAINVESAILKTPTYGADGRVSSLEANTSTGIATTGVFSPDASKYGVRAVGTASGMTERQYSYRNARANANNIAERASYQASLSLSARGTALVDIAMKKANNQKFTADDLAVLEGMISDLTLETGSLALIEQAYLQNILAYAASSQTGTSDDAWLAVKALVEADGATLDSVLTGIGQTVTIPEAMMTPINAFKATKAKVTTASQNLETLKADTSKTEYEWADLSPILSNLADPTKMTLNDFEIDGDLINKVAELMNSYAQYQGLFLTISSGGGVYVDIADHSGNYNAKITNLSVTVGSWAVGPLDATMRTATDKSPVYLTAVKNAVTAAGAPASAANGEVPITDMFGYVIDLAFRTNAADSNLMLQTEGVDRIYEGQEGVTNETTGETTMGGGAYMEFTTTHASFGTDKILNLMDAIRVVFFDPTSGNIYANAKLDTTSYSTTAAGGVKAPIAIYTVSNETTYQRVGAGAEGATHVLVMGTKATYEPATGEEAKYIADTTQADGFRLAVDDEVGTHKQVIVPTQSYKVAEEGETAEYKAIPAGTTVISTDKTIMALNQNQAHKLSVLVYLDGAHITNADVAIDGQSVTGTMNLQFSSSANLVPMDYTPLQNSQGGEG